MVWDMKRIGRKAVVCCSLFLILLLLYFVHSDRPSSEIANAPTTVVKKLPTETIDLVKRLTEEKQPRSRILLLTYLRGGSTFLADILQQSPDVFYIYEPLQPFLRRAYYTDGGVCSIYGQCREARTRMEETHGALQYIQSLYDCRFKTIPSNAAIILKNSASLDGRWFRQCLESHPVGANACLQNLIEKCENSITSFKFIRLSFSFVELLMRVFPDLKVIHYLRDPRGIINSRSRTGYMQTDIEKRKRSTGRNGYMLNYIEKRKRFTGRNSQNNRTFIVQRHAEQLCSQMIKDLDISARLTRSEPGRIKTVLYENLAQHPIEIARDMYQFVGAEFTDRIRGYIYNITMAGNSASNAYSTVRFNSSRTAFGWGRSLPIRHIEIIDEHCHELYERLGYKSLT